MADHDHDGDVDPRRLLERRRRGSIARRAAAGRRGRRRCLRRRQLPGRRPGARSADVVRVITLAGIAVLVVTAALAWSLAGRILRPVRELTSTARQITESDLSARIPVEGHDELAELGATFNEMVGRLEHGFTSQRQFLDDVAHELRTPITIARGHLEVLGDDPAERAETVAIVTDELDRMSRYVSDLLLLAKAEQPDFLRRRPVDLGELALDLHQRLRALAPRRWVIDARAAGRASSPTSPIATGSTQAMLNLADERRAAHRRSDDEIGLGVGCRRRRRPGSGCATPAAASTRRSPRPSSTARAGGDQPHEPPGRHRHRAVDRRRHRPSPRRPSDRRQHARRRRHVHRRPSRWRRGPAVPTPRRHRGATLDDADPHRRGRGAHRLVPREGPAGPAGTARSPSAPDPTPLALARDESFDLLLLDLGLPGMDGHEVLRSMRGRGETMPVIILTARDGVDDTVAGLQGGADDYVTKPFRFEELLARIRLRLRDGSAPTSRPCSSPAASRLDLRSRRARRVGDTGRRADGREFALAEVFLRHAGQVLSREQLLSPRLGLRLRPRFQRRRRLRPLPAAQARRP